MNRTFPEYEKYDAVGLAELVKNGEVHPTELLDAAIARSAERNPSLNAIVNDIEPEAALPVRFDTAPANEIEPATA